jgi:Mg-chelatase subunit ChlD
VLVDVSGSMGDSVSDAGGGQSPKIAIARRAVVGLLRKTDDFARRNPSQTLAVGIYEFSTDRDDPPCRPVVPLGKLDLKAAEAAVGRMVPKGHTPIGEAMIAGKKELDRAALAMSHLLVVTDGENTSGREPGEVARALAALPAEHRPALYFVAFDIEASKFRAVKESGGLVLSAADGKQLSETLDVILGEKILLEK